MFELILRIKESLGDEAFKDALTVLATQGASAPPHPSPGRLVRIEDPPHPATPGTQTVICLHGHVHDLPACVVQRLFVEWAVEYD